MVLLSVLVIETSALGAAVSVSVAELLVLSRSKVALDIVAVFAKLPVRPEVVASTNVKT